MSDNDGETRALCSALFNNGAFAAVVTPADSLLAGTSATVTTREIAKKLGLSDSIVRPVMLRLRAAGLLDELPRTEAPNSPRHFHRTNPDGWEALQQLIRICIERPVDAGQAGAEQGLAAR